MTTDYRLDMLKQQYFDLSKEFMIALQDNRSSGELELVRKQIREIVSEIETIEIDKKEPGE
jgi:hypothetical protein